MKSSWVSSGKMTKPTLKRDMSDIRWFSSGTGTLSAIERYAERQVVNLAIRTMSARRSTLIGASLTSATVFRKLPSSKLSATGRSKGCCFCRPDAPVRGRKVRITTAELRFDGGNQEYLSWVRLLRQPRNGETIAAADARIHGMSVKESS